MKTLLARAFALLLLVTLTALHAEVPHLINYQGRLVVGTVNFNGTGQFKFALVNAAGTTTYWSNDGTSTAGSEPTSAVSVPVVDGLYSVILGDNSMTPILTQALEVRDIYLRAWVDDGTHLSQRLAPDQRLTAVPWAIIAGTVPDGTIGAAKIDSTTVQRRVTGVAPAGSFITGINADGTVTSALDNAGALTGVTAGMGLAGGGTTGNVTLSIADGGVTNAKIGNNAVGNANIAPNAVDEPQIANGAVTLLKLGPNSVNGARIVQAAVDTFQLANLGVTTIKIADNAVTEGKILNGAVTADKILNLSVTNEKIAVGAVDTLELKTDAVTTEKIADGAVTNAKIGVHAVDFLELKDGAVLGDIIANSGVTGAKLVVPLALSGASTFDIGILSAENTTVGDGLRGISATGRGVFGMSTTFDPGGTLDRAGVRGVSTADPGKGVYGSASVGSSSVGVVGDSMTGDGVFGESKATNSFSYGVHGTSMGGAGVKGDTTKPDGAGVLGKNDTGPASAGVIGNSVPGTGVFGTSGASGLTSPPVLTGLAAIHGWSFKPTGFGVYGKADATASAAGVVGSSTAGTGVFGFAGAGSPTPGSFPIGGVSGISSSAAPGVFGANTGGGLAAKFAGGVTIVGTLGVFDNVTISGGKDLTVTGNLFVDGTKAFKIDHPLDPANKYLLHSCVESPDMMNIYNGNITTDANGDATVAMPDWFEALNRDFRYQLTVIGQFAQAIVADEMKERRFTIKTDKPNVKVSWQVTGIRHDAFADAHRLVVEVDKIGAERGHFLYPETAVGVAVSK